MTLTGNTLTPHAHTSADSPAQVEDKAIQLQRDMVDILREEFGMNEELANPMAAGIVRGMRRIYGGQSLGRKGGIYVPAPSKAERNAAIRAEFNGRNAAEVCARHGISKRRVYQIASSRA